MFFFISRFGFWELLNFYHSSFDFVTKFRSGFQKQKHSGNAKYFCFVNMQNEEFGRKPRTVQ